MKILILILVATIVALAQAAPIPVDFALQRSKSVEAELLARYNPTEAGESIAIGASVDHAIERLANEAATEANGSHQGSPRGDVPQALGSTAATPSRGPPSANWLVDPRPTSVDLSVHRRTSVKDAYRWLMWAQSHAKSVEKRRVPPSFVPGFRKAREAKARDLDLARSYVRKWWDIVYALEKRPQLHPVRNPTAIHQILRDEIPTSPTHLPPGGYDHATGVPYDPDYAVPGFPLMATGIPKEERMRRLVEAQRSTSARGSSNTRVPSFYVNGRPHYAPITTHFPWLPPSTSAHNAAAAPGREELAIPSQPSGTSHDEASTSIRA